MKRVILFLFLFLLAGCGGSPQNTIISAGVILDLGDVDYSNFEVVKLEGEGECAGTETDPCTAIAHFKVKKVITINPMQLLEIDTPISQIRGYSKNIRFEPGHTYTLKYTVLKVNPTDKIAWKFAGVV
jgi:hypothetical protein